VKKAGLIAGIVVSFTLVAAPASARKGDVYVGTEDGVVRIDPKSGATALAVPFTDLEPASAHHLDFGRDGRLYVSDENNDSIYRVDVKTGEATVFSEDPDFANPFGLAIAPDGQIVVNDYQAENGILFGISPSAAVSTISTAGILDRVDGVGVEPGGDVLLAPGGPAQLFRVDRSTGVQTLITNLDPSPGFPEGVAVAADRSIYVGGATGIQRVTRSGDTEVIAEGDPPFSLLFDLDIGLGGELFAVDSTNNAVFRVNPKTGSVSTLSSDFDMADNPIGVAVEPPKCKGKTATIVGTQKKDKKLKGGPFNDVIHALGGNDKVDGKGGKDIICGGKGKDKLKGGKGKDKLFGQAGKDKLNGGPGKDKEKQ